MAHENAELVAEEQATADADLVEAQPDASSELSFPLIMASGHYVRRAPIFWPLSPSAIPSSPYSPTLPPLPTIPTRLVEDVRLDVDGRYPLMKASGYVRSGVLTTVGLHWVANLTQTGVNTWAGSIWFKDGPGALLPHDQVKIVANRSFFPPARRLTVRFSGGGARATTRIFTFHSPYFHQVEFEYDTVAGSNPIFAIGTCAHPDRPAAMPCENLSIETVYRRAGFEVRKSGGDSAIPVAGAGADQHWSDQEMHDAMQAHWSRFGDKAQWALWVFWAPLHEQGTGLGGIMFDDIGPNHRQGTAIFTEAFISNAPAGDPNPAAWVARMRFWTAVHEMGHAFNLAHSWQKQHPPSWGTPWIPLTNNPEARSFMNYPYNVAGGQTAFFADFGFRFIDEELLFMRHAPERFVQMGNADWFDHHGFEEAMTSPEPELTLIARVNREKPTFQFLEPVVIELKATNASKRPIIVDRHILDQVEDLTVVIKRNNDPARQWHPFQVRCQEPDPVVLMPGESVYQSLFVAVGTNGWDVAKPGRYGIQVCLHRENEDIVSNCLKLRILPPTGYDEEYMAQELLTDDVGRVFAFDGSRILDGAVDTLSETVERLAGRAVARHAAIALGMPIRKPQKVLDQKAGGPVVSAAKADPEEAKKLLDVALKDDGEAAAETLGHIDYRDYVEAYATTLAESGGEKEAAELQTGLEKTLEARGVLDSVLDEVRARAEAYREGAAKPRSRKGYGRNNNRST